MGKWYFYWNRRSEKIISKSFIKDYINGTSVDEFENGLKLFDGTRDNYCGTDKDIEWIRYESYGCLAYIYVYIKNGIVKDVVFDIWSNKWDSQFVENTSIGNIETNYDSYVDIAEKNWIE